MKYRFLKLFIALNCLIGIFPYFSQLKIHIKILLSPNLKAIWPGMPVLEAKTSWDSYVGHPVVPDILFETIIHPYLRHPVYLDFKYVNTIDNRKVNTSFYFILLGAEYFGTHWIVVARILSCRCRTIRKYRAGANRELALERLSRFSAVQALEGFSTEARKPLQGF